MFKTLNPATAGGGLPLPEFCRLARHAGFEGVEFGIGAVEQIINEQGLDAALDVFKSNNIRPGAFYLR